MTSEKYPLLFSPLKVGTQEVRNRVFMPPVSTNLADHGYVTDALIDHYTARAAGGVGLIVTADAIVCERAGEKVVLEGADTMVLALGYRPDGSLAEELAAAGTSVHVIGDAEKPGNIKDAMAAAYALARHL